MAGISETGSVDALASRCGSTPWSLPYLARGGLMKIGFDTPVTLWPGGIDLVYDSGLLGDSVSNLATLLPGSNAGSALDR